ncbi:MAG: hypothetical protein NC320_08110, partial [Clostridium sp.]|nr:hypothetical protein [Clostridium sp.]MCM1546870.1 hypothetical protein [Ruminococcus sp.]
SLIFFGSFLASRQEMNILSVGTLSPDPLPKGMFLANIRRQNASKLKNELHVVYAKNARILR